MSQPRAASQLASDQASAGDSVHDDHDRVVPLGQRLGFAKAGELQVRAGIGRLQNPRRLAGMKQFPARSPWPVRSPSVGSACRRLPPAWPIETRAGTDAAASLVSRGRGARSRLNWSSVSANGCERCTSSSRTKVSFAKSPASIGRIRALMPYPQLRRRDPSWSTVEAMISGLRGGPCPAIILGNSAPKGEDLDGQSLGLPFTAHERAQGGRHVEAHPVARSRHSSGELQARSAT